MIILLTGITGLLGSHTAIDLLRSGHKIVALSRSRNGLSAEQRVRRILQAYSECSGENPDFESVHTIDGNILEKNCGTDKSKREMLTNQIDVIVHCAGHVSFTSHEDEDLLKINVAGVKNISEFAATLNCKRIIHISTAYAGQSSENDHFRTAYERSKFDGEHTIQDFASRHNIDLTIIRPGIITGDVKYGFTPTYKGIYPFFRFVTIYAKELWNIQTSAWLPHDFLDHGKINLIPADYVAAIIRAVIEEVGPGSPKQTKYYNVINPIPWKASDFIDVVKEYFISRIYFPDCNSCNNKNKLSESAAKAAALLFETYKPYFNATPIKDSKSTDALVQKAGIHTLRNSKEWIFNILDWGIKQNWKELV